jgi:hypothetical protein
VSFRVEWQFLHSVICVEKTQSVGILIQFDEERHGEEVGAFGCERDDEDKVSVISKFYWIQLSI